MGCTEAVSVGTEARGGTACGHTITGWILYTFACVFLAKSLKLDRAVHATSRNCRNSVTG